jgi:hypothetical protein
MYQASFELLASVAIFVWCCSRLLLTPSRELAHVWIALLVLGVTKAIRDGIAIAAPRVSRRLGQPAGQWHPMLMVLVLYVSGAVLLAQMLIMISWRLSHQLIPSVEERGTPGLPAMLVRMAFAASDILLSCLWFGNVPALPVPKEEARGPLKPTVTSFMIRDVGLECGDRVCAICLDEFSTGCLAGRLPCGHVFHDVCCRTWLENGHRQARCPMRCSFTSTSPHGESVEPDHSEVQSTSQAANWSDDFSV